MGSSLEGRVALITGAGRGLGRAHAELFVAEGARVVVNDVDADAAEEVAEALRAGGADAAAHAGDCADWETGRDAVARAVTEFGRLDILVNNAGALRDRALATMEADDWDDMIRVHLRGHFVPTRWAASHWRERSKAGEAVAASVVHTSSTSGLLGNPGQANYGAAKAGIAGFSIIVATELGRYGVRSNCVVPAARTRLTESVPGLGDMVAPPADDRFDVWDPANASPLVAYLATESCPFTGGTFFVQGGSVRMFEPWRLGDGVEQEARWTVADLAVTLAPMAENPH
jgi:NAD(P)-dependent dehydrogenase (short-subunit alcohol dehydrogenase family)